MTTAASRRAGTADPEFASREGFANHFTIYIHQIVMLCALNLHRVTIGQLFLSKTGKKPFFFFLREGEEM